MKKLFCFCSVFFSFFSFSFGQGHGSCDKAVLVDTTVYGPVYADGVANPLLAMLHTDGSYFEKPHIAVWFCIDIPYDTVLTFDLIPKNSSDDIDFLLFKDETAEIKNCGLCRTDRKNFCQRIATEKMVPVRANIARNDPSVKGMTGLSFSAQNQTEKPGKHSTYSSAVEVKKGERYYLVVDNYTAAKNPFTLKLHLRFPPEENDIITSSVKTTDSTIQLNNPSRIIYPKRFNIEVTDSVTGKLVKSKIKIDWVNPIKKDNVDTVATNYGLVLDKKGEKINITCYAKGYLISQKTYTAQTDSDREIDIGLLPIKPHMKMIFKHLEFEPGEAKFLSSASESLNDLLDFMNNNPDVKILIKGYVNDPLGTYDEQFDLNLSKERAEAVYNYLVNRRINKSRLQWHGYGNKEMVYPVPVNEDEMEANRRVEVEIEK